jgi:hypothetical protein
MTSVIKNKFNTSVPLPTILPTEWGEKFKSNDNVIFDSLDHFVYVVSKLTQKEDNKCGITYKEALSNLVRRKSDFPEKDQKTVENLVRSNLLKRGLITEEIYENFRYTNGSEGSNVGVDVGKYAAGEPDCVITPSRQYIDFFYELYISVSYSGNVRNETVRENVAKLLTTVAELERKHIFIKLNVVFPDKNPASISDDEGKKSYRNFLALIPIFSHKDFKSVEIMSSVVNDKLLRKFLFAVLEDFYGDTLSGGYGVPVDLPRTINIGENLDEVALFQQIKKDVGFID